MPLSDYASQLAFLKDSAHSLQSQSPSTAAHLQTVHNQILHHHFKPLNQRQKHACCGACGSIRNPQSARAFQVQKKGASGSSSKKTSAGDATVYKCLRCGRRTVTPLRREPIRSDSPRATAETSSTPALQSSTSTSEAPTPTPQTLPPPGPQVAEQNKPKTAENASSKKRAKARKQGGLQALLASKQQTSSSLDLFDFLQ